MGSSTDAADMDEDGDDTSREFERSERAADDEPIGVSSWVAAPASEEATVLVTAAATQGSAPRQRLALSPQIASPCPSGSPTGAWNRVESHHTVPRGVV